MIIMPSWRVWENRLQSSSKVAEKLYSALPFLWSTFLSLPSLAPTRFHLGFGMHSEKWLYLGTGNGSSVQGHAFQASLQILQLLWRKLHSHREHVRLEENYDKRSPERSLKLGSYLIPQAEGRFPKSKIEAKYIFINHYFDITPLCMMGQALPLSP